MCASWHRPSTTDVLSLLLEFKLNSLICARTLALITPILQTPDSRWISMSKTRRYHSRRNLFILSTGCICVCVLLCMGLQYVDWLLGGLGPFICLVWSWLSVTGPRRERALCDLPDKSHPSAVCICQGPGSSSYQCTHPCPSVIPA